MNRFRNCSPHYWTTNVLLALGFSAIHFILYINLWGMAFAAGDGGRTVPVSLSWPVMVMGMPFMPAGQYLLAVMPHSLHGALLGQDGMRFFYMLAALNALLFGTWTTVQMRIGPGLFRFLHRRATARIAARRA